MALLAQDGFNFCIVSPKRRQLFLRHLCLGSSIRDAVTLAQFFHEELQFTLRTVCQFVSRTVAFSPFTSNIDISHTHIKRIVFYFYLPVFNRWVTHGLAPVIQVVDSHPDARDNLCSSFARGG